jgi:hypothetical protein
VVEEEEEKGAVSRELHVVPSSILI